MVLFLPDGSDDKMISRIRKLLKTGALFDGSIKKIKWKQYGQFPQLVQLNQSGQIYKFNMFVLVAFLILDGHFFEK